MSGTGLQKISYILLIVMIFFIAITGGV